MERRKRGTAHSPLVLAYIGDAVYEAYVRTHLARQYKGSPGRLHKQATRYVKASAQSAILHGIRPLLTEAEWGIVKSGRNQKTKSVPKNANVSDYRHATGFETLIGHLHVRGESERLEELIRASIGFVDRRRGEGEAP